MGGMIGNHRHRGGLLPAALALLLVFRLLIPAGYMIAPDAEGRPGLALCAAPARAAVEAAMAGGHDRHPDAPIPAETGELPCAYAAPAAPPLPPDPPAFVPPIAAAAAQSELPAAAGLVRVMPAAAPPPSTGPPLSV